MSQFDKPTKSKEEIEKEEIERERAAHRAYAGIPQANQKHIAPKPNLSELEGDNVDDE